MVSESAVELHGLSLRGDWFGNRGWAGELRAAFVVRWTLQAAQGLTPAV